MVAVLFCVYSYQHKDKDISIYVLFYIGEVSAASDRMG